MSKPIQRLSTQRLNELLVEMLRRRSGLITPDEDAFKPWLPESYWIDQEATKQATALINAANEVRDRRRREDEYLASLSVAELIGEPEPMWKSKRGNWGMVPMAKSYGALRAPTPGDHQPRYLFECYQCGRPITNLGQVNGPWFDHSHRTGCDRALVDPADIVIEGCYAEHMPKPIYGEEEDDL